MNETVLAVDMGGSHVEYGIVRDGTLVAAERMPVSTASLAMVLPLLEARILEMATRNSVSVAETTGIAMGICAVVQENKTIAATNGKYDDGVGFSLAEWGKSRFGLRCLVENDARLALLGEHFAGAAQGFDDAALVTLGTGIGGAILLGGKLLRSHGEKAGGLAGHLDLLDTIAGGNLSLQVHPLRAYIVEHFHMLYTQDESYYLLDAEAGAVVYLGLKPGTGRAAMARALEAAQSGGPAFPADEYVNAWPVKKHDHISIPAGTIHCSGKNSMVLEISATPYIFTFKLWDWERLGLNGLPRPIHLAHGLANIQWERDRDWVKFLINPVQPVAEGTGWREESTGLHPLEFLETRRHWFTQPVMHNTAGTLNVLNLVEGEAAIVESPSDAFPPLTVHYAETFIVPACVGEYRISPAAPSGSAIERAKQPLATIKAFIRRRA